MMGPLRSAYKMRLLLLNIDLGTMLLVPARGDGGSPIVKFCCYEDSVLIFDDTVLCSKAEYNYNPGELYGVQAAAWGPGLARGLLCNMMDPSASSFGRR